MGREMASDNAPRIGNENTYVGAGPVPAMGDGNTIYTLADANSDVLINKGGTAIGAGARADSTSVAIGALALGGDLPQLAELLAQLRQVFDSVGATEAAQAAHYAVPCIRASPSLKQPEMNSSAVVPGNQAKASLTGRISRPDPAWHHNDEPHAERPRAL
jgi:hypothetical protein